MVTKNLMLINSIKQKKRGLMPPYFFLPASPSNFQLHASHF
jgi:hypothetical protein